MNDKIEIGKKIYEIKYIGNFFGGFVNRSAKELLEGITATVYHSYETYFYTHPIKLPRPKGTRISK